MKHIYYKIIPILLLFFTVGVFGQTQEEIQRLTKSYIEQSATEFNLNLNDIREWSITSEHISEKSGIHHVYGIQKYHGIEIYNALFDLHIFNKNEVVAYHNHFLINLDQKVKRTNFSPNISAINATQSAAKQLNLTITKPIVIIEKARDVSQKQLISASEISSDFIPARLMYYLNKSNELILVWDITINELNGKNWWSLKVDASSGLILDKVNWVQSCSFGEHKHFENKIIKRKERDENFTPNSLVGGYNVYPFPIESPNHGNRSLVTNPDNAIASPFGWHDTNGIKGAEYFTTRGNNVHSYESNSGFSPNGGSSLTFNFAVNTTYSSGNQSEAAVITNLFYWNNILHDIWYQYGFDEASGNFQEKNYTNAGSNSDYVNARAQVGLQCNAFFGTPPDGSNPTMSMYIGNCGTALRDGSIDNVVIAHEYGHGISKRLVGGRTNTNVLLNQEQMGEGWSDWVGLMMTIETNDQEEDLRPVGTWLLGQNANGVGIREWPYSTNMTASQYTYDDIKTLSVPHGVGSVWSSMLWEVTWELINVYGFDSDLYTGSGGNNIAMQLVIEGLKLTPNSPGFIDARDAILQADQILYNGANQCYLWKAFAKRGLGVSAKQGSVNSRSDGVEAFDEPECDSCLDNRPITQNVNSGQTDNQQASNSITATNIINSGATANYDAGNTVFLRPGFHAKNGANFRAFIQGCSTNRSRFSTKIREDQITDTTSENLEAPNELTQNTDFGIKI